MKPQKKVQAIPVNSMNSAWQNFVDEAESSPRGGSTASDSFNVNMLDYMTADDFVQLMKVKTDNNYNALWRASKILAMQLKASKSVLSLNSLMSTGKNKMDVIDKLCESVKYALKADFVYIFDIPGGEENCLRVLHSNNVASINQRILISAGIEGKNHFYVM
jgi:hypothetical protein